MQETWVWSLIQEELPCHRATKPMYHNYWASALEPRSYNYWAHVPQLLKPECPRACVLQQEKPSQWEEAWAPQLENRPHSPCFPGDLEGKASAWNAGDPGSIPESGRSPGEGNGNPLQYSCLENPMDGGAWEAAVHGVAKSQTWLSDFTFTCHD